MASKTSQMGAMELVEGRHGIGSAREAPQWRGNNRAKLGFRMLKIVKIHGYGGSIYRAFWSLSCA
jgi:hypothetical protein